MRRGAIKNVDQGFRTAQGARETHPEHGRSRLGLKLSSASGEARALSALLETLLLGLSSMCSVTHVPLDHRKKLSAPAHQTPQQKSNRDALKMLDTSVKTASAPPEDAVHETPALLPRI